MKLNDSYQALVPFCFAFHLVTNISCSLPSYRRARDPRTDHIRLQQPGLFLGDPLERLILKDVPRKKHLKPEKLMRRMKNHFDPDYMSITRPSSLEDVVLVTMNPVLQKQLHALNLSQALSGQSSGLVNDTVVKALELWLLERATCPVYRRWTYVGPYFWPRWVKVGYCFSESSCSWPPGMNCVPAKEKRLKILQWKCSSSSSHNSHGGGRPGRPVVMRGHRSYIDYRVRKVDDDSNDTEDWASRLRKQNAKKKMRKRCKWVRTSFPVTDDCFCSC